MKKVKIKGVKGDHDVVKSTRSDFYAQINIQTDEKIWIVEHYPN